MMLTKEVNYGFGCLISRLETVSSLRESEVKNRGNRLAVIRYLR